MPHVGIMVGWAREEIEQPIANEGYWDELGVLDRINEAYAHHVAILTEARGDSYSETYVDVTGAQSVALPPAIRRVTGVQMLGASGQPFAERGTYRQDAVRSSSDASMAGDSCYIYGLSGDRIYFAPPASGQVRIFYVQDVPDLLMGDLSGLAANADNEVILPNTEVRTTAQGVASGLDGVYIGHDITMLTSTASIMRGVTRRIIAYDGDQRTLTVASNFTATPGFGNETFAMHPTLIPAQFHRMLSLWAAIAMRQSRDEPWQHLQSRYDRLFTVFQSAIEDRYSEPASVREWEP